MKTFSGQVKPYVPPFRPGESNDPAEDTRRFMHEVVNNRDQLWGEQVSVTFPGAGTAVKVATGLSGNVKGYMIVRRSADIRVWDATPPSSVSPIVERGVHWLQANAAGTVTLYIF
jgi:hypothetical protein